MDRRTRLRKVLQYSFGHSFYPDKEPYLVAEDLQKSRIEPRIDESGFEGLDSTAPAASSLRRVNFHQRELSWQSR